MWRIGQVAGYFGLRTSTLRFWEDEGLLCPAGRRGGCRVYDENDLRRVALIMTWRDIGLMDLGEIRAMLDGGSETRSWRETVQSRLDAIDRQQRRLEEARRHLVHLATCPRDNPVETCPYLSAAVDGRLAGMEDPQSDGQRLA